jgi:hypothetical protein
MDQSAEQNGIALDAHAFEREHVRRLAGSWLGLSEESSHSADTC